MQVDICITREQNLKHCWVDKLQIKSWTKSVCSCKSLALSVELFQYNWHPKTTTVQANFDIYTFIYLNNAQLLSKWSEAPNIQSIFHYSKLCDSLLSKTGRITPHEGGCVYIWFIHQKCSNRDSSCPLLAAGLYNILANKFAGQQFAYYSVGVMVQTSCCIQYTILFNITYISVTIKHSS